MHLIPVIDLKDGVAVHAKLGLRAHYSPIQTPLCHSPVVAEVIAAFLSIHPFKIIYLADLNAITENSDNDFLISTLLTQYPEITFWVDSGYQAAPSKFSGFTYYQAVLGSECYEDDTLDALNFFKKNFILSLDFSAHQQPLGSKELFSNTRLWPEKVILMTLARVGSHAGVDVEKLLSYQKISQNHTLIAAGGIKDKADLVSLQNIGIKYALCASALHSGVIGAEDLRLPVL